LKKRSFSLTRIFSYFSTAFVEASSFLVPHFRRFQKLQSACFRRHILGDFSTASAEALVSDAANFSVSAGRSWKKRSFLEPHFRQF
jgi:hypothetical protein